MEVILEVGTIYSVPKVPETIYGIINYRGRIITCIDLALMLGLQKVKRNASSRIIVLVTDIVQVGLFVSKVFDFLEIKDEVLQEPPLQGTGGQEERFVKNIFKYDFKVFSVLDIKKITKYLAELVL